MYTVEFDIIITNAGSGWTNVFHFTANGNGPDYGDRIPALWINSDGYFYISSAINGHNDSAQNNDFELGKRYQITIQQFIASGTYWYQIIIDGESMLMIENTQPQSFSSVRLYTSDPWYPSFTSDLGSICNVKIHQEEGKILDQTEAHSVFRPLFINGKTRDPFFPKLKKKLMAPPKSMTNDVYLTPIKENLH